MVEVNSPYNAESRSDNIKARIGMLERLAHHTVVNPTFDVFDAETEEVLIKIYGASHKYIESYKYATVGEAEAIVNLPDSAGEARAGDGKAVHAGESAADALIILDHQQDSFIGLY